MRGGGQIFDRDRLSTSTRPRPQAHTRLERTGGYSYRTGFITLATCDTYTESHACGAVSLGTWWISGQQVSK